MVFTGCNNDSVQGVELGSVSAPKNVTAAWAAEVKDDPKTEEYEGKSVRLLVTWNAVVDADGYDIVYSQEGAKNYLHLSDAYDGINVTATTKSANFDPVTNEYTYTVTHTTADTDIAQWERNQISLIQNFGGLKLRIGVVAKPKNESHKNPSKPAWAKDLIDIPSTYKDY
jgi:hypothetical protein